MCIYYALVVMHYYGSKYLTGKIFHPTQPLYYNSIFSRIKFCPCSKDTIGSGANICGIKICPREQGLHVFVMLVVLSTLKPVFSQIQHSMWLQLAQVPRLPDLMILVSMTTTTMTWPNTLSPVHVCGVKSLQVKISGYAVSVSGLN